ncbi:hypothetical protein BC940DRAFT_271645 [Gongronella butleri]|nr:hypothetical protein BC940DRAFT_271645 [Gongronella butleri]
MLIKTLSRWDFCPFKLVQTELIQSAFLITRHVLKLPGLEHINILDDALYDFLLDVANMYHELNPYHNFQHAVDVMQATFYFLCRMGILSPMDQDAYPWIAQNGHINQLFTSLDALALLLASLGHDIGHPGLTNIFLVRTHTPLAMLYNDRSVLENFHATVFFNILQRHGFGANGGWLAPNDYGRFRKVIVQSILATDMGLHDDYVLKIQDQKMRLQKDALDPSHPQAAETDILLICGSLIKCADISNCSRPFPLAKKWAGILKEEFSEQGDLEKSLGLSVLPMHDRDETGLAKFQLAFKRNIAAKLFENVATTIPDMQYSVTILKSNCDKWEERLEKKQGDKQPQDAATTVKVPAQSESASNPMQAPPDAPPAATETKQALNGASAPMTPSTTVVSTANIAFKPTMDGGSVPDKVAPVVKTKKKKNKCVIQ